MKSAVLGTGMVGGTLATELEPLGQAGVAGPRYVERNVAHALADTKKR